MAKAGLTPKQARFVAEYLIDLNATQAAIRAGYSPKTAFAIGSENLRKPLVAEAIKAGQAEVSKQQGITLESHLAMMETLRDKALAAGQFSAAITAEANRGKVAGLYVDKVEDVTKLPVAKRRERLLKLLA